MCYLIESRDEIYVKGYGCFRFARNLSNKYSQKLLVAKKSYYFLFLKKLSAKKSTSDAIKTASKRAIQKAAEATLIGKKIAAKNNKCFN